MFAITGETYEIRDQLKQMGCSWNADENFWVAPDATAQAHGQALADAEPLRLWRIYADTLAWVQGSFTDVVWDAGLRACSLGIPAVEACAEVSQRITQAGGKATPAWVKRNVGRAYGVAQPPKAKVGGGRQGAK